MSTMFEDPNPSDNSKSREIQFSEQDRPYAARLLRLIVGEQPHQQPEPSSDLAAIARAMSKDRKQRVQSFHAGMFGEPAWDILLMLYGMDKAGLRLTIGQVLLALGCGASTGNRWLEYLEVMGLIQRYPHSADPRTSFVGVTDKARDAFSQYLGQLQMAHL